MRLNRLEARPRELLRGRHEWLREARVGEVYVAGVNVAGENEEASDVVLRALHLKSRRDSTVITTGRIS